MAMMNKQLSSLHVLVTRPSELAGPLCEKIRQLNGHITLFPCLEITEPVDSKSKTLAIDTIKSFDYALFISPTTVLKTATHIDLSKLTATVISLGSATTKALEALGCSVDIKPDGHDSEALLRHPLLQKAYINKKQLLIFKGEGGRNLLTDTFVDRGAVVVNANMYRRQIPDNYIPLDAATLETIDVILISSGEGLNNLFNMTEDKPRLLNKMLIVPGKRCKTLADNLGFTSVMEAENATDSAFIKELLTLV